MPSRRRSRERALQMLFLWDVSKLDVRDAVAAFYETMRASESAEPAKHDAFADQLATGVASNAAAIDKRIVRHAEHWRIERMPAVDRNILRLAVYEMVHGGTPAAVAIDEALELARRFSSEESVQFVNGVLDAVNKEVPRADLPEPG